MTDAWIPDAVCETHVWKSARWVAAADDALETVKFVTRTGAQARMMPPVTISTMPMPQGGRVLSVRHEERLVTLPVVIPGATGTGRPELRRWARALDPAAGTGTLTVIQGAHPGRYLPCLYEAGLDDYAEDQPGLGLGTLAFRAPDPYWQSPVTAINVTNGTTVTLANLGDVPAWPRWYMSATIGAGGVRLRLKANSSYIADLQATGPWTGSLFDINTAPGVKSVQLGTLTGAYQRLTATSTLWAIPPAKRGTTYSVEFTADTPLTETIQVSWNDRWLTP